ncbi:tryptophan 2,3-dioxygenase [Actinopolyspora erythraea]|uniref:Tryptophan 2,3-dioxygenase n=1 Tax=Actinopolyspora erythraea TaxID=414996 RepID=A0ABR4X4N0_9ACTN|nr:tryptophan 2,3-dioxygenase [Actinopolyspora erythraea]
MSQEFPEVVEWFREHLERPNEEMARSGAVCPFAGPARSAETLDFRVAHVGEEDGLSELAALMDEKIEEFEKVDWPEGKVNIGALVVVVRGLPEKRHFLLDDAQSAVKGIAVRKGLMIGQFYPSCPDSSARNPLFRVSQAPEPLFVIRRMAFHDILFLHDNPVFFAEYEKRFGHYYTERGERNLDPRFVELYHIARGEVAKSPYIDYQSIDTLLSLQLPHTREPAELTFYLVGQTKELLFKLIYREARFARVRLAENRAEDAVVHLERIKQEFGVLSEAWNVLGTLSPVDFSGFRDQLGVASGVDSYMFRMMEFMLGKKSEEMAGRHRGIPGAEENVHRALRESSVYDEAVSLLLERRGEVRPADVARDFRDGSSDAEEVVRAWADVYRSLDRSDELFRLAESLVDVAEAYGRWCCLHMLTVERVVGSKEGTGGTSGVSWLRKAADYRLFPELWRARTLV